MQVMFRNLKKGARQKQDHNPRLPKNRLHQSRTAYSPVCFEESMGYSSLERKGCRRALRCQQFGGVDSCSTHNLQCFIWNTTTSSGCLSKKAFIYWSESWERLLRYLKSWRFCHMRTNQASRNCLAVKREKPGRVEVESPSEYLHLHLMEESKDDGNILF